MLDTMAIQKIASFSDGTQGGNPAGVWIGDALPTPANMQRIAAEVGFSETAFAAPLGGARWLVRYFSPESEVPFVATPRLPWAPRSRSARAMVCLRCR